MTTTVILGSGIIGVSTAFYLSQHQPGSTIHLVEPSPELFASASGYAGGFLARNWFSPAVAALGSLSFDEHRSLAEREGGRQRWGYAPSKSFSHAAARLGAGAKRGDDWLRAGTSRAETAGEVAGGTEVGEKEREPSWLGRSEGDHLEVIAEEDATAQVDPKRLCEFLLEQCLAQGVQLHHPSTALSVATDVRDELASVRIGHTTDSTETDVPCARLVIAAGAWSPSVFAALFPRSTYRMPVTSLSGHSIVLRRAGSTGGIEAGGAEEGGEGCYAVFSTAGQGGFSPEMFSRVGGDIYLAGLNSAAEPLPMLPTDAKPRVGELKRLRQTAEALFGKPVGEDRELRVVREGLCFRPVTPSGLPLLGRVPDEKLGAAMKTREGAEGGVYVATGTGPWGISLSLGIGRVMAEIMQGREVSADVSACSVR